MSIGKYWLFTFLGSGIQISSPDSQSSFIDAFNVVVGGVRDEAEAVGSELARAGETAALRFI